MLIKYGNIFQNDTLHGGNSLFGESESIKLVPPELPVVTEINQNELLKKEKELVGMYLSAHPLDQFAFEVKHFTTATVAQASDMVGRASKEESLQGKEIIIAGIITNVKISYTRSTGKPFANFMIEDFNGSMNFAVYGRDYEAFMQYMQPNLPLLIKCSLSPRFGFGRPNPEDSKPVDYELKVKRIRHLANTKEEFVREITLNIPVKMVNPSFRLEFLKIIKANKGKTNLIIKFLDFENKVAAEFFSEKYRVSLNPDLMDYFNSKEINCLFVPSLGF